MDKISTKAGVDNIASSLGGVARSALETGFDTFSSDSHQGDANAYFPPPYVEDESVGNEWEFSKTGACGRPRGNAR
ncbi:MAG TPA: hypothetical protein PLY42_11700 [Nitrospira sp.]|jgi:hypothetical protein|nr:hypothetical protein [Nitrospira sp.]HMX92026.1 hypothetical protein [Nitrospira sp.]HNC83891.1 hypothetical protein [Nitrospira sp.]HNG03195.1 hypothetical protein [Nitrospira sp.]HNG53716.1 hypothetical protein [Nitrospira sp.]